MKFLNKKFWVVWAIVSLLLIFYFGFTLNGRLFFWGVTLKGLPIFFVNSQKESVTAHNRELEIIVKRTKTNINKLIIETKTTTLMDLYKGTSTPYPEAITNISGCAQEFLPVELAVENGKAFSLFANERKSFGVCSADLIKYKAAYGIFDCGTKGVFEVGVFDLNDKASEAITKFRCNYE